MVSNWTTISPGCDEFAGFAKGGDGHIGSADHGGGEHFGVATLEFAAGGDGESDAALFDLGGGEFQGGSGGCGADEADGAPGEGADYAEDGEEKQGGAELHFLASFLSGSTSVTMAPGWIPVTATSSGLRARTSTLTAW